MSAIKARSWNTAAVLPAEQVTCKWQRVSTAAMPTAVQASPSAEISALAHPSCHCKTSLTFPGTMQASGASYPPQPTGSHSSDGGE